MQARHGRHVVAEQKKTAKQLSQLKKEHALSMKSMQDKIDDRDKIIAVSCHCYKSIHYFDFILTSILSLAVE
jgi:hypothetical protein